MQVPEGGEVGVVVPEVAGWVGAVSPEEEEEEDEA